MNNPNAVLTPQPTAKIPQIEFVIVNDERQKLIDLLSATPDSVTNDKVCPVVKDSLTTDTTNENYFVKPYQRITKTTTRHDKINIDTTDRTNHLAGFLSFVTVGIIDVAKVVVYVIVYAVTNFVKYAVWFVAALVVGCVTGLIDALRQTDKVEFDDYEPRHEPKRKTNTATTNNYFINVEGNATFNTQINK